MNTKLYSDPITGTYIELQPENVAYTVALTVGGEHVFLTADDVDRLLAVREHAVNPVHDIAEFLTSVFTLTWADAMTAADAFVASSRSLAEAVYG